MTRARTRPLFEEPSLDSERADPWSGPKGFMFGGMFLPAGTNGEMAQQYFDAANLLVADIEHNRLEDYKLANPILFLFRHWLELMMKEIIGRCREHDLGRLAKKLNAHLLKRGVEVPAWVTARLNEMAAIDPLSVAFRYAEDRIDGEIYVSLPHLKEAMATLNIALSSVASKGVFPPEGLFTLMSDEDDDCFRM
jgi:hypothetical protein